MKDTKKCINALFNLVRSAYVANLNSINLHTEEDKAETLKHLVGANAYVDLVDHWNEKVEKHCGVKFDTELEEKTAFQAKDELKPMIDEIEEFFEITPEAKAKLERELKEKEKLARAAYV